MIIVHGKSGCSQCTTTTNWLSSKGIEFTYKDLDKEPELLEGFLERGFRSLPVVIVLNDQGEEVEAFSGFYMGRIMQLEKHGKSA